MSDDICPDCNNPISTHEMFNPPRCPVIRFDMAEYRRLECDVMLAALKRRDIRAVQAILAASPPDDPSV